MKSVNILAVAFGLVMLIVCILAQNTSSTVDRSAYTQMEDEVETLLKSPDYTIKDPYVSIGPAFVKIEYVNNGILQVSLDKDLNYVIDQYIAIVNRFPEITGPLMIERIGGAFASNEIFEYQCKREWVDAMNAVDIKSIDELRYKVRLTEETKPMTQEEIRTYNKI
jgi:hypothetical protein